VVLITSSGDQVGHFSLFRTVIEDHLLLDVDLFSSDFRMALSGAVYRAINRTQIPAKVEDGRASKPAAKAASSSST
jgi:hypothetical protein